MLREYTRKQLEKCVFADLSNFDLETNTFYIKKYSKPKFETQHCYLVSLLPELLEANSLVAANWNNGSVPPGRYLKIYVSRTNGVMIYVDSLVYDIEKNADTAVYWSGWLPTTEITQLVAF